MEIENARLVPLILSGEGPGAAAMSNR
jgi:hypothetical protein